MRDVLIVDYDPELREQVSHVLNGGIYALTFASDGVEALKLVKNKRYDLILVDLLLPGAINGIQILQGMHRHAPDSPLVVISERNGHQEFETALRYGAKEVLLKPVHSDLMKSVADKLTGTSLHHSENAAEPEKRTIGNEDLVADAAPPISEPAAAAAEMLPSEKAPVMTAPLAINCNSKLLNNLPEPELQELLALSEAVELRPGEEFNFDSCQTMVILCKGQARCWYNGLLISVLDPGEVMGESALFNTAEATLPMILDGDSSLQLRVFSKKALRNYFQHRGHRIVLRFSAQVVQSIAEKLGLAYREITRAQLANSEQQCAGSSYNLLDIGPEDRHEWIC